MSNISDAVSEAKKKMKKRSSHACCDVAPIEYEKGEITYISIETAENGFMVQANGEKVIATTKEEAGEAVTEFLS